MYKINLIFFYIIKVLTSIRVQQVKLESSYSRKPSCNERVEQEFGDLDEQWARVKRGWNFFESK